MTITTDRHRATVVDPEDPSPAVPAWDPSRDRRAASALLLLVWVVYLATANYTISQVNDNHATTVMAWSLGTRGTIALPESWRGEVPWEAEGADGQLLTDRFPGAWLWAAPFHAVAGVVLDRGVPSHPALVDHGPSGVAAATAAALGVLVSFLLFRRLADRRTALVAAGVLAFATGTWSVSANEMWTHGMTHLTLALGILAAARGRSALTGTSFALAIVTRPQTAVVPLVVGIWHGVSSRSIRPVLVIGITSGLGVLAMTIYSQLVFDTWLPIAGYRDAKVAAVATVPWMTFLSRVGGALFDPMRGILIYTPFVIVLALFVRPGWRASPWWVRASAIGGLLYFVVQLRANGYAGGAHFFGSRLGLEPLVLAAPLLLRTWQVAVVGRTVARRATVALVAASFILHAAGAIFVSTTPDRLLAWHDALDVICADDPSEPACERARERLRWAVR